MSGTFEKQSQLEAFKMTKINNATLHKGQICRYLSLLSGCRSFLSFFFKKKGKRKQGKKRKEKTKSVCRSIFFLFLKKKMKKKKGKKGEKSGCRSEGPESLAPRVTLIPLQCCCIALTV